MTLLSIQSLNVNYGYIQALRDVALHLDAGETVAAVGANGAGKSTLLRAVIGAVTPVAGVISFAGKDIGTLSAPQRVAEGIAMVPEGRQVFVSLTVEENLLVGMSARRDRDNHREDIDRIYERFPNLAERRHFEARVLSGGEQQMLAIGRALMARPRLLLLDEPSLGLSPAYVNRVYALLEDLQRQGMSMLLVEQNVTLALKLSNRAYVLELGRVALSGKSSDLMQSQRLREAYLGRET
ncbi:MAG: ABC transporter ATP-binding protein [Pseudorhodoplanes sp.]|uniref:ABC transporter ATP-binding protein n=1 Tax=Pseudorhodoplanes sp. TaxID=1934341 RepID=UPI003D1063C9